MGRLADFLRLAWALLYWNARKSVYRLRGRRGRCPCHHPSDSGRAGETACAAVTDWDHPARFRRVCPLLQRTTTGVWRCSVDSQDVRPFWGRAVVFYALASATSYLLAALMVFGFLHTVGYQVTYPGVLWPPAWKKSASIRADFFLNKYHSASNAGDMPAAIMALATAYNLDPQNYQAGRMLAQFWQVSQPGFSDQLYRRLLAEHPAQTESTAQLWFRALLARGDFPAIEQLAQERIRQTPASASAWINAFLFANLRTHDAAALSQLAATPALPVAATGLLQLANDLAANLTSSEAARRLRAAAAAVAAGDDGFAIYNVSRQLIARGLAQEALNLIERRPDLLGPRDAIPLRLDALASLGWLPTLHSEIEGLLVPPPGTALVELLSAHLIRHPSRAVSDRLFSRLARTPLPENQSSYQAYLALFCAAGVCGDQAALNWTRARIKKIVGSDFPSLDVLAAQLVDPRKARNVTHYLPALQPLPLEVQYALFDHFAPVR